MTRNGALEDELESPSASSSTAYEELQSTVEELETTNEELQSTNEELETTNEELQSTNEELETMNEELQSTNEELETINDELRGRSLELDRRQPVPGGDPGAASGSASWSLDREQRVQIWNERAELWGVRADEAQGTISSSSTSACRSTAFAERSARCSAAPRSASTCSSALNRRGRTLAVRVTLLPFGAVGDTINGAILITAPLDGHDGHDGREGHDGRDGHDGSGER